MAGKGKKNGAQHAIALAMQEVARLREEMAKFFSTLKPGEETLKENIDKLDELSKKIRQGERNVRLLTEANNALNGSNKKNTESTKGFVQQLMQVELSIRRISSGLNNLKNAATFANKTAESVNQLSSMALAINASAEEMKKLEYASLRFGVGLGETNNLVKMMKKNLADLRWGGSGGAMGTAMKRWGVYFNGRESEKDLLVKLQKLYLRVKPQDRVLVQSDFGLSDNMTRMFSNFKSPAEFREYLDKFNIKNFKQAEAKSAEIVASNGEAMAAKDKAEIANMAQNGAITKTTNEWLKTIYDFMAEHPWMSLAKTGSEAIGGIGSMALGGAGIAKMLRLGRLTTVAAGAGSAAAGAGTAAAGTAAASAGASALPAILVIAAALAIIAGGWVGITKISEYLQEKATGKKENESDEDFEKRVAEERKAYIEERAQKRQDMIDKGAATRSQLDSFDKDTQEHLKEFDADVATSRATIKKNNDLIAKQQAVIDRLGKHEIVPDSELAILSQYSGNQTLNKQITDQLGGTRDLGLIKQNALASATTESKPDDFLAQQLTKYVKSKKLSDLTDVFKTENVGKLDNKQWEMFGKYISKALPIEDRMRMRSFVEDAPLGYAVPSNIRNKSSEITQDNTGHGFWWKFLHGGAAAQDGGMQILDAIEKEKEHDNGADILKEIVDYSKKPTVERAAQRNKDMIDGMRQSQEAIKESARSLQGANGINVPTMTVPKGVNAQYIEPKENGVGGDVQLPIVPNAEGDATIGTVKDENGEHQVPPQESVLSKTGLKEPSKIVEKAKDIAPDIDVILPEDVTQGQNQGEGEEKPLIKSLASSVSENARLNSILKAPKGVAKKAKDIAPDIDVDIEGLDEATESNDGESKPIQESEKKPFVEKPIIETIDHTVPTQESKISDEKKVSEEGAKDGSDKPLLESFKTAAGMNEQKSANKPNVEIAQTVASPERIYDMMSQMENWKKAEDASNDVIASMGKVDEANDIADSAQAQGGVVNNVTNNNNTSIDSPIEVKNQYVINQTFQKGDDAGSAFNSVRGVAMKINEDIADNLREQVGAAYRTVCGNRMMA